MAFAVRWRGDRVLWYEFAPPLRADQKDVHESDLPEPPYEGAPKEERSAYYWWWAFLRENDGYRRYCEQRRNGTISAYDKGDYASVFADFGDPGNDFWAWWSGDNKQLLFCEQLERRVKRHGYGADGEVRVSEPGRMVISFPLEADKDRIKAEIAGLVEFYYGSSVLNTSPGPKYRIESKKAVPQALYRRLKLLQGKKAGLTSRQAASEAHVGHWTDSHISEMLHQARAEVENVGLVGRFPVART